MAVSFDTLNPNAPIFKELSKGPSWWVRFKDSFNHFAVLEGIPTRISLSEARINEFIETYTLKNIHNLKKSTMRCYNFGFYL